MEDERPLTPEEVALYRRLMYCGQVLYPFTKQELVIGLQKTIKEKLPLSGDTEPTNAVQHQIWLDTSGGNVENDDVEFEDGNLAQTIHDFQIVNPARAEQLVFEDTPRLQDGLEFGESSDEHLVFEGEE